MTSSVGSSKKASDVGWWCEKEKILGVFLTKQRPILSKLTMFSSVVPAETLGYGCWGLGLREREAMALVKSENEPNLIFAKRERHWFLVLHCVNGGPFKFFQGLFCLFHLSGSIDLCVFLLQVSIFYWA